MDGDLDDYLVGHTLAPVDYQPAGPEHDEPERHNE